MWKQAWAFIEAKFSSKERAGRIYCRKYGHIWQSGVCFMCDAKEPVTPPDVPQTPIPDAINHLIGAGMFLGVMPWRTDGVSNDAPRDMATFVSQWAAAGGNLIQVQLLYEEGALFDRGLGLELNIEKVAYCREFAAMCKAKGVFVTFVIFDHCSLKYGDKWAKSPLNKANGGPFAGPYDIYNSASVVVPYAKEVAQKLNADNVIFEIINEGPNIGWNAIIVDALKSVGITRITCSGENPGGLWRFSAHGANSASWVKSGELPNTDGVTWGIGNVTEICKKVLATPESGYVWDGVTDSGHNWDDFCKAVRAAMPQPQPEPGKCGCDLSKPWNVPPYTAEQLAAGGNAEECPVPFPGMDIRLHVRSPNGTFWLIGSLFQKGLVTYLGPGKWCGKCTDADGGRYHFLGWSKRSDESDLLHVQPGVSIDYNGTQFAWFEFRGKSSPTPQPSTDNVPPIIVQNGRLVFPEGWTKSSDSQGSQSASSGEFHGRLDGVTDENSHYTLRGRFWGKGYQSAFYVTPDNPKRGYVIVSWNNNDPKIRGLTWRVAE